jgi:hypothetical protein
MFDPTGQVQEALVIDIKAEIKLARPVPDSATKSDIFHAHTRFANDWN